MAEKYNRDISSDNRNSPGNAQGIIYNEAAGGQKVVQIDGLLKRLDGIAAVSAVDVDAFIKGVVPGSYLAFFNTLATPEYIGFQEIDGAIDFGVTAVSSVNGIALRPYDYTVLVVPWNTSGFRASAAGVLVYQLEDASNFVKRS